MKTVFQCPVSVILTVCARSHVVSSCVSWVCKWVCVTSAQPRLVLMAHEVHDIIPLLRSLHWLPVSKRIQYKIATLSYKCIHKCIWFRLLVRLFSALHPFPYSPFHLRNSNFPKSAHQTVHRRLSCLLFLRRCLLQHPSPLLLSIIITKTASLGPHQHGWFILTQGHMLCSLHALLIHITVMLRNWSGQIIHQIKVQRKRQLISTTKRVMEAQIWV